MRVPLKKYLHTQTTKNSLEILQKKFEFYVKHVNKTNVDTSPDGLQQNFAKKNEDYL